MRKFHVQQFQKSRFVALVVTIVSGFALVWHISSLPVLAITSQQYQSNMQKQQQLRDQIKAAQGQEKTLNNEIARMNNQISLNELELADTQGQIQSTENLLVQVNSNIDDVSSKLGVLDGTITRLEDVADARIRESYKQSRTPAIGAVIAAHDFRTAMLSFAYVNQLEAQDNKLLSQINTNRANYREQKNNLAKLKAEKEDLADQLNKKQRLVQTQQKELNDAKANKSTLLAATKNDEATYQRLLAQVQAELLTVTAQRGVYLGHMDTGSPIARQGNTGCSTGSHLHFEVQKLIGGRWTPVNPHIYLDSGQMHWPEKNFRINQEFGVDPYGLYRALGESGHTGIDISSGNGSTIYAAADGDAYTSGDGGCPRLIPGTGPAKGVIINHSATLRSLYWHIQ